MNKVGALVAAFRTPCSRLCYRTASVRGFSSSRLQFNSEAAKPAETEELLEKEEKPVPTPIEHHDKSSIKYIKSQQLINDSIITALQGLGFEKLTPVQHKTLEPALTDDDLVTKAKTGTGKTLAFGIPMIEEILRKPKGHHGVRGLIIAPTRDLAFQIRDELDKVAAHREVFKSSNNSLTVRTFVGGESRWEQIRHFKNRRAGPPSIIVATPGRFLDVIKEPVVADAFTDLQTLVLDEADRLLGDGFREDLVEISDLLKELRERSNNTELKPLKTMLFSATMDKSILEFSKRILRTQQQHIDTVDPNEPETHEKIAQSLILTNDVFESYVSAALFIQNETKRVRNFKAIVFLPTVKSVSYFYETLSGFLNTNNAKIRTYQLHGQLRQPVRDRSVKLFRESHTSVLVASDVGARGMDFPNVTNVIQIGLPMDATNYVHRVGRTARGGKTGNAVMILTKGESRFTRILKNRNVIVTEKFEYEKSPEAEAQFSKLSQEVSHKNSLEIVLESLCGFSKSVVSNYRLNLYEMLEDISKSYGKFVGDETKLPPLSHTFIAKVLGLGRRDASELFATQSRDHGDNYGDRGSSNRGSSRRNSDENDDYEDVPQRSNYRNNNSRGGYGGQQRGSFNKGGYGENNQKKRFSNDRRDSNRGWEKKDRKY